MRIRTSKEIFEFYELTYEYTDICYIAKDIANLVDLVDNHDYYIEESRTYMAKDSNDTESIIEELEINVKYSEAVPNHKDANVIHLFVESKDLPLQGKTFHITEMLEEQIIDHLCNIVLKMAFDRSVNCKK